MKLYKATLKNGMPVITVLAEGFIDAAGKIEVELHKNSSRMPLWDKWLKDGKHIKAVGHSADVSDDFI